MAEIQRRAPVVSRPSSATIRALLRCLWRPRIRAQPDRGPEPPRCFFEPAENCIAKHAVFRSTAPAHLSRGVEHGQIGKDQRGLMEGADKVFTAALLIAVLPPTEPSTCANKVVGMNDAALQVRRQSRSVPPPSATT